MANFNSDCGPTRHVAGLHCHAIKNINRNHSINQVKNLVYDMCGFIRKSVSPKFMELCMETPCWCPSEQKHLSLKQKIFL